MTAMAGSIDTEWLRLSIFAGQNPVDPLEALIERWRRASHWPRQYGPLPTVINIIVMFSRHLRLNSPVNSCEDTTETRELDGSGIRENLVGHSRPASGGSPTRRLSRTAF